MMHIAMLLGFIGTAAGFITYLLFIVTNNPWLCCFILAGTTVMFVLENLELQKEAKSKDEEIEVLNVGSSEEILKQMNGMVCEIKALKIEREEQRDTIHNLNFKLKQRIRKASSI